MNPDNILLASAVSGGLDVQGVTQYLFWIATVAMACGTAFFWLSKDDVLPKYRSTLIVSRLITGVAGQSKSLYIHLRSAMVSRKRRGPLGLQQHTRVFAFKWRKSASFWRRLPLGRATM